MRCRRAELLQQLNGTGGIPEEEKKKRRRERSGRTGNGESVWGLFFPFLHAGVEGMRGRLRLPHGNPQPQLARLPRHLARKRREKKKHEKEEKTGKEQETGKEEKQ